MVNEKPSPYHERDPAARRQNIVDAAARVLIEAPEDREMEVLQRMLETYIKAFRRAYPDASEDEIGANVLAYADTITDRKLEILASSCGDPKEVGGPVPGVAAPQAHVAPGFTAMTR